jgi:hypothetical protein
MLGFTMIEPSKFQCDTCGEIVHSGIISITDHFAKCFGKDLCENVKKIDESNLSVDDKMDLVKNIFSVTQ